MSNAAAEAVAYWLTVAMLVAGPLTLLIGLLLHRLACLSAPYGRFASDGGPGWGPLLPGRFAWVTQELPSLLVPILVASQAGVLQDGPGLYLASPCGALAAAFLVHYSYRSLVYPLRLRAPKGTALVVWAMATTFCCWNGFIQAHYLFHQCPNAQPPVTWHWHHICGLALWLLGWLLNLQSDGILRNLRTSAADTGYKIPHGGLFEYVSAANYTAECMEWAGWALAAWALPPTAFAVFTFSNLAPRADAHHDWYWQKFKGEYPAGRKAIIPFVW